MLIKALAFLVIILVNAGCSYLMPPQKIPMDRRNYIEAVSTSWKEQLLTNLVKLRYGDTLNFLEMTSITTGYEFVGGVSASYPTQWHPLAGTTGFRNVVPVGGSVAYADRPTITYVPLKGEALTKTVMTPLPLSAILRSLQTGWRAEFVFSTCIESINRLRNHSPSGHITGNPAFFALANRMGKLSSHGVIRIAIEQVKVSTEAETTKKNDSSDEKRDLTKQDKGDITLAFIMIDKKCIDQIEDAKERAKMEKNLNFFYKQLDLNDQLTKFEVVDGNRDFSVCLNSRDKIVVQTRSIFESLNMLSEFIEVPEEHAREKRAHDVNLSKMEKRPWLNCVNSNAETQEYFIEERDRFEFKIRQSLKPPSNPFAAVKYHDRWFFIDDTDICSKFIFSGVVGIFSMAEPPTKELTPVLTLPVQ